MSLVATISKYRRECTNWFNVLYQLYRIRNKVKDRSNVMIHVILRGSKKILDLPYPVIEAYIAAKSLYNPRIHNITINKGSLAFSYDSYDLNFDVGNGGDLFASLFLEEYNFLNVEGKDVVDIGANLGDSAIYFAIKGAKKIISLEPYPYTFALAVKNIGFSGFNDKIEIINAGYGEDKEIKIDTSFIPDNGTPVRESLEGQKIDLISLQTLITKYNIESGILKMDCEGCEYSLLKENNEIIKKFSMIQIEYHYGYEKLVNKLKECGFHIKHTEPKEVFSKCTNTTMNAGYIYGWQ